MAMFSDEGQRQEETGVTQDIFLEEWWMRQAPTDRHSQNFKRLVEEPQAESLPCSRQAALGKSGHMRPGATRCVQQTRCQPPRVAQRRQAHQAPAAALV